jgi:FKBP-type peptidyl-prolyl cis-trans isomerase
MQKYLTATIVLLLVIAGCQRDRDRNSNSSLQNTRETKKQLEHVNKLLVEKDKEQIEAYIKRHQLLEMQENKAGLFYLVWGDESGVQVETNDIVVLNYKVSLLDGTECYNTSAEKPKEFLVGKGGVESGLEMAVLLMKEGQKGKFILPPHLGHGLIGDSDKIPPLAILVFDVELLEVIKS